MSGKNDEKDRFILRFHSDGQREALKRRAARNKRALNAEILFLIEKGIAADTPASVPLPTQEKQQDCKLTSVALRVAKEFDSMSDSGKVELMEKIMEIRGRI